MSGTAKKLQLLTVDKLTMREVADLEQFSRMSIPQIFATAEDGTPFRVLMALAWLTARRDNPRAPEARKSFWDRLPYSEFQSVLEAKFEFEQLDDDSDDDEEEGAGEDPTNAG